MFGLIRDLTITFFIILIAKGVYEVDDLAVYNSLVVFISGNQASFLGTGAFALLVLLGLSAIFEEIGLYKITYGMSKILVRLSQLLITFLALLNIVFYISEGGNFLHEIGYFTIVILFLILAASCWTIRLNDFNYHSRNAMAPVGVLAAMSILFVGVIWPAMGV